MTLTQLALKSAVLHEIARNADQWAFKVTQGHQFWYRSKARMRLPINNLSYLAPFPSYRGTVVQIIAFDRDASI